MKIEEDEDPAGELSSPRLDSPEKESGARGFQQGAAQEPEAPKDAAEGADAEPWTKPGEAREVIFG